MISTACNEADIYVSQGNIKGAILLIDKTSEKCSIIISGIYGDTGHFSNLLYSLSDKRTYYEGLVCKYPDCEETELYKDGYCKFHYYKSFGETIIQNIVNK